MENEVAEMLKPVRHDWVLVDCTVGYGGHSAALTTAFDGSDVLIGIDRDARALDWCRERFRDAPFRRHWFHGGFEDLTTALAEAGMESADAFFFDCGFSSPQVDEGERGFSFMREGPLDMRMDQRQSFSAYELVNTWSAGELADCFKRYGEERFSRKIASGIVRQRQKSPIETTQELADLVIQAIPAKNRRMEGIHPATRVFQAIRIAVNDELESLRTGLQQALDHLRPGGRVGVLSYHSLEHRIVKEAFHRFCGHVALPVWAPTVPEELKPKGSIVTRKAITPCAAEQSVNPRCRSAQLRVVEKEMTSENPGDHGAPRRIAY